MVEPSQQKNRDQVFFGATVTYADEDDRERTVRIVGIDEADTARGEVSWVSPIARALLKAREGDVVELRTPLGPQSIETTSMLCGPSGVRRASRWSRSATRTGSRPHHRRALAPGEKQHIIKRSR